MKYPCRLLPWLFLAVFAVECACAETPGPTAPASAAPWTLENVAINPSSKVIWGHLENGLRYAIMPHASPPGHISMRLLVTAGSLDENDDERGYAHFVEHMAFNGTTHFPAGELIKFLERQGAANGADVNAATTPTHTLYKLELPDNSTGTLETGLRIFRDFADGILFQPAEVKRERGVILSEERSRHTPEDETQLALTDFLYRGTRIPDRQPIGLIPTIEHATAADLQKFYRTWYRPENMSVIVVGEIDAAQVEALVKKEFASFTASGPAAATPSLGNLEPLSEPAVVTRPRAQNGFHISVFKVGSRAEKPFTWGTQLEGLRVQAALAMLQRRLDTLTNRIDRIISGSNASLDVDYGKFRKLSVVVASSITDWEKAMAVSEQEVRRVTEHGFEPSELTSFQTRVRDAIQRMAQQVATLPSPEIAELLADSLEERSPTQFRDEGLEQSLAMCDRLTPEDCQRAFREYWGGQPPHIFIETAAEFMPSVEKIRSAYLASQAVAVDSLKSAEAASFAYDDFGPAGEVAEKTYVKDLDFWRVHFANGVRLNVKRTPFENGRVRFNIQFGTGGLDEPADKPGLHFWVGSWLVGGLKKQSFQELTEMPGAPEAINIAANDDAFSLSGGATTVHFARALHESAAFFTEPGFRPEGNLATASQLHTTIDPLWNAPEGAVQLFILPSLTGNNPRIGLPNVEGLFARTPDEFKAWFTPFLANSAIEIAVVGDIDVDTAITETAKTFGTLPARKPKPALTAQREIKFSPQPVSAFSYYNGPADRPSTLEFFWPVRDRISFAERWRLKMLALIVADRVTEQVRQKKGATYAPSVSLYASNSYPGFSYLRCTLEVKPQDAVHFGDAVRDLGSKLASKGITEDELTRAKAQYLSAAKAWQTDNNFWLSVLSEAQERPDGLQEVRTIETDVSSTTAVDLNGLARRYLGSGKVFRYIIEPSARKPQTAPTK